MVPSLHTTMRCHSDKQTSNFFFLSEQGWLIPPQANTFINRNRKNTPLGGL